MARDQQEPQEKADLALQDLEHVEGLFRDAEESGEPEDFAIARHAAREFFAREPELLRRYGDVSRLVESRLIKEIGAKGLKEYSLRVTLDLLRRDLGYEESSGLERLLIDRLLACWLRVQQAELVKSLAEGKEVRREWATVWDRRLEIAHRNFLRSVRTLALVRRKPVPQVLAQVNIGGPATQQRESMLKGKEKG